MTSRSNASVESDSTSILGYRARPGSRFFLPSASTRLILATMPPPKDPPDPEFDELFEPDSPDVPPVAPDYAPAEDANEVEELT